MKRIILSLLAAVSFAVAMPAFASEGGAPLDRFPKERLTDVAALQNGAKLFVNYCLNCHSASVVRYNRLTDSAVGLNEAQIKDNLLFATDKVGDTMTVALQAKNGKEWFGTAPPDLSLVARSRASGAGSGADYLYTYMRTFYRDDTKATGWNNLVFPSVAMPHVLWELQGQQRAVFVERPDPHDAKKIDPGVRPFRVDQCGQPQQDRVRRRRGRPGGLPAMDGRTRAEPARAHRRVGVAVPWPVHAGCLAFERRVLERREVTQASGAD